MATPPISSPPTIGETRARGIRNVRVTCSGTYCRHEAYVPFNELPFPDHMIFVNIPKAKLLRCTKCGSKDVTVMPDWRHYAAPGSGRPYEGE